MGAEKGFAGYSYGKVMRQQSTGEMKNMTTTEESGLRIKAARLSMSAALAFLGTLVTGCATVDQYPVSRYHSPSSTTTHRFETNYQLGAVKEAFVGEPMVRVRDFIVTTTVTGGTDADLVPTNGFTMALPPLMIRFGVGANEPVPVVGTTERGGKRYRVVSLPRMPLRFLITDDGAFEGSAINSVGERMGWTYIPSPSSTRLIQAAGRVDIQERHGSTNFELVYGGISKDSLHVLYREYTTDNLARPAFTQSLVYDKEKSIIRFKNIEIEVKDASNQRISFLVVSDDHGI